MAWRLPPDRGIVFSRSGTNLTTSRHTTYLDLSLSLAVPDCSVINCVVSVVFLHMARLVRVPRICDWCLTICVRWHAYVCRRVSDAVGLVSKCSLLIYVIFNALDCSCSYAVDVEVSDFTAFVQCCLIYLQFRV